MRRHRLTPRQLQVLRYLDEHGPCMVETLKVRFGPMVLSTIRSLVLGFVDDEGYAVYYLIAWFVGGKYWVRIVPHGRRVVEDAI